LDKICTIGAVRSKTVNQQKNLDDLRRDLGKGEVVSSILTGSTRISLTNRGLSVRPLPAPPPFNREQIAFPPTKLGGTSGNLFGKCSRAQRAYVAEAERRPHRQTVGCVVCRVALQLRNGLRTCDAPDAPTPRYVTNPKMRDSSIRGSRAGPADRRLRWRCGNSRSTINLIWIGDIHGAAKRL
jgi:hypothetical protein